MAGSGRRLPLRTGGFVWGQRRVALGVSLEQLARATHINVGDLSKMEHGRLIPRANEYDRVTAALRDAETAAADGVTSPD